MKTAQLHIVADAYGRDIVCITQDLLRHSLGRKVNGMSGGLHDRQP